MDLLTMLRTAARVASRTSTRNKGLFKGLKKKFPKVPEYVLKEVYNGDVDKVGKSGQFESMLKEYDSRTWKLEKVELHWDLMSPLTKSNFRRRKFGIENPDGVPDDAERLERQVNSLAGQGENEPMIFLEVGGKLELVEGFHRTMALLLKGSGDVKDALVKLAEADDKEVDSIASGWSKVPAKAWVGRGGADPGDENWDDFEL